MYGREPMALLVRVARQLAASLLVLLSACQNARSDQCLLSSEPGHCDGCKAGEYAIATKADVTHGDYVFVPDPPCVASYQGNLDEVAKLLEPMLRDNLKTLGP